MTHTQPTIPSRQQGISALIFVLFAGLLATVILAAIQSRVLLGAYRSGATEDTLIAGYDAESLAIDVVRRIMGSYALPTHIPEYTDPASGTKLSMESAISHGDTHYRITGRQALSSRAFRVLFEPSGKITLSPEF